MSMQAMPATTNAARAAAAAERAADFALSQHIPAASDPSIRRSIQRTPPVSPEHRLWSQILLGIYNDVSVGGQASPSYREAVVNNDALEFVAVSIGYRSGAIKKLLQQALAVHARRQA